MAQLFFPPLEKTSFAHNIAKMLNTCKLDMKIGISKRHLQKRTEENMEIK